MLCGQPIIKGISFKRAKSDQLCNIGCKNIFGHLLCSHLLPSNTHPLSMRQCNCDLFAHQLEILFWETVVMRTLMCINFFEVWNCKCFPGVSLTRTRVFQDYILIAMILIGVGWVRSLHLILPLGSFSIGTRVQLASSEVLCEGRQLTAAPAPSKALCLASLYFEVRLTSSLIKDLQLQAESMFLWLF